MPQAAQAFEAGVSGLFLGRNAPDSKGKSLLEYVKTPFTIGELEMK